MINLEKGKSGQHINLSKSVKTESNNNVTNLNNAINGLGWLVNKHHGSMYDYDLDSSVMLLQNGVLKNRRDLICYFHPKHDSNHVELDKDDREGSDDDSNYGEVDCEQIRIDLDSLDPKYTSVVSFVTIYEGHKRKQHFGNVEKAYIRTLNSNGEPIFKFELGDNSKLDKKCAFVFGEYIRTTEGWFFKTICEAYDTDKIDDIADIYANPNRKSNHINLLMLRMISTLLLLVR
jgi:tellurium resistance protein TerD